MVYILTTNDQVSTSKFLFSS